MQVSFSKLSTKLFPLRSSWTISFQRWICKLGILAVEIHAKPMTSTRSVTKRSSLQSSDEDSTYWVTSPRRQNLKPSNGNLAEYKRTLLATKCLRKRCRRRFSGQLKTFTSFNTNEDVIHKDSAGRKLSLFSFSPLGLLLHNYALLFYAVCPYRSVSTLFMQIAWRFQRFPAKFAYF